MLDILWRLPPACFPGKQVEVESDPFLQRKAGNISQFTHVDLLKVEPADVTVNDSILRLLFNSNVAE